MFDIWSASMALSCHPTFFELSCPLLVEFLHRGARVQLGCQPIGTTFRRCLPVSCGFYCSHCYIHSSGDYPAVTEHELLISSPNRSDSSTRDSRPKTSSGLCSERQRFVYSYVIGTRLRLCNVLHTWHQSVSRHLPIFALRGTPRPPP